MSARLCTVRRFFSPQQQRAAGQADNERAHTTRCSDRQQQRTLKGGEGRLEYRCFDAARRHPVPGEGSFFISRLLAQVQKKH